MCGRVYGVTLFMSRERIWTTRRPDAGEGIRVAASEIPSHANAGNRRQGEEEEQRGRTELRAGLHARCGLLTTSIRLARMQMSHGGQDWGGKGRAGAGDEDHGHGQAGGKKKKAGRTGRGTCGQLEPTTRMKCTWRRRIQPSWLRLSARGRPRVWRSISYTSQRRTYWLFVGRWEGLCWQQQYRARVCMPCQGCN